MVLKLEREKSNLKERCGNCGKTIIKAGVISLSQWLFRPAECQCETPSVSPPPIEQAEAAKTRDEARSAENLYPLSAGTAVGHYRIIQPLGAGGMGCVYRAEDVRTNVIFAVKVISADLAERRPLAKRFEQEARTASLLTHAGIAAVYEVGETEDKLPFFVMDCLDGPSLEQKLKQDGYIEIGHALSIFIQIAEALAYAHKQGVVHRDIKPSNILFHGQEQDFVKLVDFGIAKVNEQKGVDATKLTQTGELFGSPLYMSPEQCRGDDVDARSDIYSFGCVMFECLTGRPPFQAENPVRVILKHLEEEARPLPKLIGASAGLKYVVARCLSKDPKERYQSADALLEDLHRVREGKRIFSFDRKKMRGAGRYIAAVAAVCMLAGASIYYDSIARFIQPDRASMNSLAVPSADWSVDASGWDKLDIQGQRYLNNGEYSNALKAFEDAAVLPDATNDQKILSLKKIALIHHLNGERVEEKALDKQVVTTLQELDQRANKVLNFQIHTLSQSLKSISKDKNSTASLARELVSVCDELIDRDKLDEALKLVSSSLGELKNVLGPGASVVFQLENIEAECLYKHGDLDRSLKKTESLLERLSDDNNSNSKDDNKGPHDDKTRNKTRNNNDLMNAGLLRLALINNKLGNGAQSEPFLKMLLKNIEQTPALKNSDVELQTMLAYGKSLWLQSRLDEAIAEFKATLAAARTANNFAMMDSALTELTNTYTGMNKFTEAENELLEALKSGDRKPLLVKANYLSLLGGLYFRQNIASGVTGKAQPYFEEAMAIYQHILPPESSDVIESLDRVMAFSLWKEPAGTQRSEAITRELAAILERKLEPGKQPEGASIAGRKASRADANVDALRLTRVYARLTSLLNSRGKVVAAKLYALRTLTRLSDDAETSNIIDEAFYSSINSLLGSQGMNQITVFLEGRVKRIEAAKGPNDITVAFALDDVAHNFARVGDWNRAKAPIERAAMIVRSYKPGNLTSKYRWLAGGVLTNYAYYLSRTGHQDYQRVVNEANEYRYSTRVD